MTPAPAPIPNGVQYRNNDTRLSPDARARLDALHRMVTDLKPSSIGYPSNFAFDYQELLPFLEHSMNNIGDPFSPSNTKVNTHAFEREVVEEFAKLTGAPPAGPDQVWGYVTNGGTEGNLYGLFLARELNPDAIVYYSEDTHYSVAKILRLMGLRSIMIRRQENGEMDYEDLFESLKLHRHRPPILFLNAGTTMTGAIDRVRKVVDMLQSLCFRQHYIHVDAALMGMVLPFCPDAPVWNFSEPMVDSISISGHKFIGAPIPCGVVLARKRHVERIARSVEYVGALDTTVMGSRDAFSPLVLWHAFQTHGHAGFNHLVQQCLETADHAVRALNARGIPAWRNSPSITVVFPRPSPALFDRWTLAPYGNMTHLVTVPHVTREVIDAFVQDLAADFASRQTSPSTSTPASS